MNTNKTAVSIGKFECLHRGHQKLIRGIRAQEKNGLKSMVVTIDQTERPLMLTPAERDACLRAMGVAASHSFFLDDIRTMEPEQFVEEILVRQLSAAYVTCGTDFRFGYRQRGDAALLKALGRTYGFTTEIAEKELYEGRPISSTWVREALDEGDMETVTALLGFAYVLTGTVQHGKRLGHQLGMPTVNIALQKEKLLPPFGVYVSLTRIDGVCYESITNIGCKPSVQSDASVISAESYLYAFDGDLYGKDIAVFLCSFFRPEQKFGSIAQLKARMEADVARGASYFAKKGCNFYKNVLL